MNTNSQGFVSWEEHIICHERGSRVVHFYLKDTLGNSVLAVVGTERSIRHMMYVVPDEFLHTYGSEGFINNTSTKWRARREVVDWLTAVVSKCRPPVDFSNSQVNDSRQDFGSLDHLMTEITYLPDQMVMRKLRVQNSDIEWSGVAWNCAKQLTHYPSFCRNGTTIAVHSFVFIMAEEESHYLGYLEDMYEDKKGQKKVKVRWFHHNKEVKGIFPDLNPHPREVFITAHVQVISAECVDGLATVLTRRHYEKCVAVVPNVSPSSIHICFRQIKNNKVKSFTLTKLRGYSSQAIVSALDGPPVSKQKVKCHEFNEDDGKQLTLDNPTRVSAKRSRTCKGQGLDGGFGVKTLSPADQITNSEPKLPKLKLRLSRKTMDIKVIIPQSPASFKVDDKIELLCQDSGIRGCWFRCKVLRASPKLLKVKYDDVEDADGFGNLEEWVPASKVAAPDKLGMRFPGRLTIRPCPPEDATGFNFEVGAPVDAWWTGGWWEGVVIGVDISRNDAAQVYIPGEDKFLDVQRKNARISKDWVGNKWVDVMGNPDILSYISANFRPSSKLSMRSPIPEAPANGNATFPEQEVLTAPIFEPVDEYKLPKVEPFDEYKLPKVEPVDEDKLPIVEPVDEDKLPIVEPVDEDKLPIVEPVDEDKQETAVLLMTDDLRKLPHHNNEDETTTDCGDEDDNKDANDNDNDRDSNDKAELVSEDNVESAYQRKFEVLKALEGTV